MKSLISTLAEYFEKELSDLGNNYQWKIPKIAGFKNVGERSYTANVELKKFFNRRWSAANDEEKAALSKIIVSDWGGVKNNHRETLISYIKEIKGESPSTPLKGVASYSKIFAITNLDKYAIYDARVAVCLNAVQWNRKLVDGVAFNYIPGRNNITGHAGKKIGFAYEDGFKVKSLTNSGWKKLNKDETYQYYLSLLIECLKYFPRYRLYDLEMVLFANAEKECVRALQSVRDA